MYRTILFDLDGTLTDSSEGIYKCICYAMEKMGDTPIPPEMACQFIGPPLEDSFQRLCGYSPEDSLRALHLFRERYAPLGSKEVKAVDGIAPALRRLQADGRTLAVASSKEERACHMVIENLGLTRYFTVIAGHNVTLANTKEAVIRSAMERLGLTETDREEILMVGDRHYDVEGAAACGIRCLGVDFCGFAPQGELEAAGAIAVVSSAEEMADYILAR